MSEGPREPHVEPESALHQIRCVVLIGRGSTPPESLITGLSRRGAQVRIVYDGPGAILELAGGARAMLIVFEPDHVAHLEQVIAAVKQYFPGVAIRRLVEDEAHHPQIATFPETDRAGAEPKPEAPGSSDPEGVSQRKELLDDADIPSAPLVTEQELAMLIEPVFDEPAGDEPNER